MARRVAAVLILAALVAAGSIESAGGRAPHRAAGPRLKAFDSCGALVRYARRHVKTELRGGAGPGSRGGAVMGAPASGQSAPQSSPQTAAGDSSSSQTNVQEAGVNEPDLVKSRGSRIFALAGGRLHAVETAGGKPRRLGSLALEGFAQEMLLRGERLLVIGYAGGSGVTPQPAQSDVVGPSFLPRTLLTEVDVSDPAAMRVVRTQSLDGSYVNARKVGSSARVVISSTPDALTDKSMRAHVGGWAPTGVLKRASTGRQTKKRLTSCRHVRRPRVFSGLSMLTVLTIDMDRGLPAVDSDALMTDGQLVYGSTRSLYVATQRWIAAPQSSDQLPPSVTTAIHKFDASEPGRTTYRASGSVRGSLLSQWSLSENGGVLRAATTDSPVWWSGRQRSESESLMTVMEERGGQLAEVGRVGGLGHGERIYAVRFIGDTAFVVTFRQTDPLYTVDLSSPEQPKVVGALKLLGYSAYLHPVGGDLLLGVGQDATEEGRTLGTQLSLFDISDLAKPVRLHHRAIESDSSSEVEYDPHAFLYWAPSKLAVIPVEAFNRDHPFIGAIGFHVDRSSGIGEAGRATHGSSDNRMPILRTLVVDGRLFTVSELGVEMDDLATLDERAFVPFSG
ncbi:MAG TPA: beta-propeller domain-containing protein [Thermoleophilaceae bacterium]|jgi:uncharacterized secreted protein with C-terminal beta-propeller domain